MENIQGPILKKHFTTLGRCKIKTLNCCLNDNKKCNPANILGCCVLTLRPVKVCVAHYFHALGHACKYVLRCKKLDRIGHRSNFWAVSYSTRPEMRMTYSSDLWCCLSHYGPEPPPASYYHSWNLGIYLHHKPHTLYPLISLVSLVSIPIFMVSSISDSVVVSASEA